MNDKEFPSLQLGQRSCRNQNDGPMTHQWNVLGYLVQPAFYIVPLFMG